MVFVGGLGQSLGRCCRVQRAHQQLLPSAPHQSQPQQVALEVEHNETSARFVKGRLERTTLGQVRRRLSLLTLC